MRTALLCLLVVVAACEMPPPRDVCTSCVEACKGAVKECNLSGFSGSTRCVCKEAP